MKSIWTQAQQKYLDDRFDNLEIKINTRIDNLETKMEQKFHEMEQKFHNMDRKIDSRFDAIINILARNGLK